MFKNFKLKFLAVALALGFWVFVFTLENSFAQLPQQVPLKLFNLGEKLAVSEMPDGVQLIVRTQNAEILKNLQAADFEAYIDLKNVGVGEKTVPVSVNSKNPQVTILRVEPAEIDLVVEPIREKPVNVRLDIVGDPALGYELISRELSEETVKVLGAESALKQIDKARATIRLDGTEQGRIVKKASLEVIDAAGILLSGFTIEPDELTVTLDFSQKEIQKQVGIRVRFSGALAAGFVESVTVTPAVATITGEAAALNKIDFLETEPVSLNDRRGDFTRQARLIAPDGITVVEPQSQSVTVEISVGEDVEVDNGGQE